MLAEASEDPHCGCLTLLDLEGFEAKDKCLLLFEQDKDKAGCLPVRCV